MVVATPIGNLQDMTPRALEALAQADVIAAEDTRHSATLTRHFGISTSMLSLHEHNETRVGEQLLARIRDGEWVALICDAGTPLISDPGFSLVRAAREAGCVVTVFPGACAAVAALSVSGLPSDRFCFEGFLPARGPARRGRLTELAEQTATLIFYESSHRIEACLRDMVAVLGADRPAAVLRELTKLHEQGRMDRLAALQTWLEEDANRRRGEFVVVVGGAAAPTEPERYELSLDALLDELLGQLPLKSAVASVMRLTGASRNDVYSRALARRSDN